MNAIMLRGSILFLLIFALIFATNIRTHVWMNEYTLWSDVVKKSPNKVMPHLELGNAFVRRGALQYAEREFKLALDINPRDTRVINGLAVIYIKQKKHDDAIRLLEILASDKPNEAVFHSNLGVAYMEKGFLDEAIKVFNAAIKVSPDFPDAYANLGLAYKKKGMLKDAKKELEKALLLSPEHRDAKKTLSEVMGLLPGNYH